VSFAAKLTALTRMQFAAKGLEIRNLEAGNRTERPGLQSNVAYNVTELQGQALGNYGPQLV
jgi:hypothetical protein